MYGKMRTFKFMEVYQMASIVEVSLSYLGSFMEISWEDPEVIKRVYKPLKISVLHHYIYGVISASERGDFMDRDDLYDDNETLFDEIQELFDTYDINIETFKAFKHRMQYQDDDNRYPFREWFDAHQENFAKLWGKITDEVFHLLFANRTFLLNFNKALADYLQTGQVSIPHDFLAKNGRIKRISNIPSWVKKAVYFRDRGRCVFCQKDISGLLDVDRQIHIDHIVPLKLWGTNDPCNMQLLCAECNLSKSGGTPRTEFSYQPWWDY